MIRGGGTQVCFGKDVPPWILKVDPYKYQFFKKKWSIPISIGPISGQILSKIKSFIFKIPANVDSNLKKKMEKSTHSCTKICIL